MPLRQGISNTCDNRHMTQNFAEVKYTVLRPTSALLFIPLLVLALSSALLVFLLSRFTQVLEQQVILISFGILVFFFWLLPSISYLTKRITVTSNRVEIRSGLFGTKKVSGAWGEFTGVSLQRGFWARFIKAGDIHLHREFGTDLVISRIPQAKKLTKEFERFLASRRSVGQ